MFRLLFLFFLPSITFGQYFSGDLVYKKSIIAKDPKVDVLKLMSDGLGTDMVYTIMNGYYKSVYLRDGAMTYSYIYHADDKRMYDETATEAYITFRDSRKANSGRIIRSTVYYDSVKTISGHPAFMVERIYEGHIDKTWYAKDLRIDPESFNDHKVGNWYDQIKEVDGALSLGSHTEYPDRIEIFEVVEVKPRVLSKSDFKLPPKIAIPSSEALDKKVQLVTPGPNSVQCYKLHLAKAPALPVQPLTIYISFILSERGKLSDVTALGKGYEDFKAIAKDIISSCGLEFVPGEINGERVTSRVIFPIVFGE